MSLRAFPKSIVRFVSVAVAAALTFAPGFTYTVSAASAAAATSALSVTSDPVDAAVYVDGRLAGTTPLKLDGVTVGDHRVRVVRDGYLENSRVVSVGTGKPNTVAVKLTRDANNSAVTPAPGGGSKKWLYIGLGVAAVGAAALLLGGSSGNKAPTVSVGTPASFGLLNASSISFSANGSDGDGDSLTYSWTFSNGQTATGQNPSVVFTSTGAITGTVTVSDGKASATATTTAVTIRSMSGTWRGSLYQSIYTLTQTGTTVTGTYVDEDGPGTLTAGSISAASPNFRITVNQPQFGYVATFTGNPDGTINVFTGSITGTVGGSASMTLTRQ